MKAFHFRYQSILKMRLSKEDQAKKVYADALGRESLARQELEEIFSAVQSARLQRLEVQKLGGNQGSRLQYLEEYIVGSLEKIKRKKLEIEKLEKITKDKHKKFMECYRERKVMEKIREGDLEKHKKAEKKKETKKIEDQVLSRIAGRGNLE